MTALFRPALWHRLLRWGVYLSLAGALGGALLLAYALLIVAPNLPALDTLTDYRPKIPLRIFTADKVLIGEFGQEHRDFVPIKEMPGIMKQALLAIEDERFYEHGAIDLKGALRAALVNLGGLSQGASTITMQVARNFFLTKEKTYLRKLNEILLAYKIEASLSKDQILELYMNQIYLGERAYGFASAANVYFGKPIKELTLAETAMLAGLPKAPAAYNPVVNPKRARQRQQYILQRMRDLGHITQAQYAQAAHETLRVRSGRRFAVHAEYVAETVRRVLYAQYQEETYTRGLTVYTTINKADQEAAYEAVRQGVTDYDRRHGYRGPEAFVELPEPAQERQDAIDEALQKRPASDELLPAVVISASPRLVRAEVSSGEVVEMTGDALRFAAPAFSAFASQQKKLRPGAVIRVAQDAKGAWSIAQLPEVAAALVAIDAQDGSYRAVVGGFDFNLNQYDHASQAWRQPGSSFKPFIYSAALEKGFAPSTLINDNPLVVSTAESGGPVWQPKNDDNIFAGPLTMRTALAQSKNVVSVRILRAISAQYAQNYVTRFGFDANRHPANLTMALGTGAVTPLQMAAAYAVFANGGYQVAPYLIQKVVDARGDVLLQAKPVSAGQESLRVLDQRNAFIMDAMLQEVVRTGTGALATQKLGRTDLAGKTGTTSDAVDGWFAGYGGNVVAVSWMGYDDPKSLGSREFGATLALPAWISYMRTALHGRPEFKQALPDGLLQIDDDWMYAEYAGGNAVRTLGLDEAPDAGAASSRNPVTGFPSPEQEKARAPDAYRNGP